MGLIDRVRKKYVIASRMARYLQMFNFLPPEDKKEVERNLKYFDGYLRTNKDRPAREDAMMWAARIYRDMKREKHDHPEKKDGPKSKAFQEMLSALKTSMKNILREAGDNNIHPILNYRFQPGATPEKVLTDLQKLYIEWQEMDIGEDRVLEKGNETFIKFENGWQWQVIPEGYCEKEGDAMHHCGNMPSVQEGDRLLSLREPIKDGKKTGWKPHATFILDKDGLLGEMKGYANTKPKESLHKYIVKLLESPEVDGILGGGYEPKENFSMDDLPDEVKERLYEKKPGLMPLVLQYERDGVTPTVMKAIRRWDSGIEKQDFVAVRDGKPDSVVVERFKSLRDFAHAYDSGLERAMTRIDDIVEVEDRWNLEDVWNNLSAKEETQVLERIFETHKKEVTKWAKENDFDTMGMEATVKEMLDRGDLDDVRDELISAGNAAAERGYSDRMFRDAEEYLEHYKMAIEYEDGIEQDSADLNVDDWDSEVSISVPITTVLEDVQRGAKDPSFSPSEADAEILSGGAGDPSKFLLEEIMDRLPAPEQKKKRRPKG